MGARTCCLELAVRGHSCYRSVGLELALEGQNSLWEVRGFEGWEVGEGVGVQVALKGQEVVLGGLSSLRGGSELALWGQGCSGAPQLALESNDWLYVCKS